MKHSKTMSIPRDNNYTVEILLLRSEEQNNSVETLQDNR